MTLKRASRADVLLAVVAGLASLAYFLSYFRFGYIEDEGYLVEGVSRILDGQVIYRDFHHTYAPGRFYVFALLFLLFGKSLLVVRAAWAILLAVKAGLAYWIGRRLTSRPFGILLALMVTLIPGPWHKTPFSFSAYLLLLGMLYLLERPGPRVHLWVGLLTGATALFRQDVAGFAVVGTLAIGIARALGDREGPGARSTWREFGRSFGTYLAGILVVVIPILIAFGCAGALGDMARGILVEGMKDNRTNQLPFPNAWPTTDFGRAHVLPVVLLKLLFYLPLASFALVIGVLVARARRRTTGTADLFLLGALILSAGGFNQSLWRSDLPHLYQSLQPVYLLVTALLYALYSALEPRIARRAGRWVLGSCLLALPILLVGGPLLWCWSELSDSRTFYAFRAEGLYTRSVEYTGTALIRRGRTENLDLERAPLVVSEARAQFLDLVGEYLDETTPPGGSILSVPGFQTVHFLFDRRNPTRYIHVRRSLGSPEEEDAFIRDIIDGDTRVILFTEMAIDGKPERRFRVYARRVYDWIAENYVPDLTVGHLVFFLRNDQVDSEGSDEGGTP